MKRTLFLACIGVLALALNAPAEDNNQGSAKRGTKARNTSAGQTSKSAGGHNRSTTATNSGRVNAGRNASGQRVHQHAANLNTRHDSVAGESNLRNNRVNTSRELRSREVNARTRSDVAINRGQNLNRERNFARQGNLNRERNVTINRERNISRERNVSVVNNWRGQRFSGQNYAAFRNYHREWHDRGWWTNHYPRITFYFGAPYYWNSGYWYPAWGYYPGYTYQYDGPIYGYNGLAPDQVTVNVQVQLQRDGYYSGPVDGILGPQTREAIAAFQADHGLAITSAIDEPTLSTLGLV